MNDNKFLKTKIVPRISYSKFILSDRNKKINQIYCLINLLQLENFYKENKIMDVIYPEYNEYSSINSVNWAFEVYKMKRAILCNKECDINHRVTPIFTQQANQVFILAIIKEHIQIISFFLSTKLINVNQSIFPSGNWPSYYLLACSISHKVAFLFNSFWIRHNISWNGLTSSILLSLVRSSIGKNSYLDFISYKQYYYLNKYRSVNLIKSITEFPIFLLDFACLLSDTKLIKTILDSVPETGNLSRISFIVQNEEHILLILSRYGYRLDQNFNKTTPLHYSCYCGDFCTLSILLYMNFPIVRDGNGKYPNEVGSYKMREMSSIFLNLFTNVVKSSKGTIRVFSHKLFRENIKSWMKILKYNPEEFEKYVGLFRYLDFNKNNRLYKKSRFSIIGVFGIFKTPDSVEKSVQKLIANNIILKTYSNNDILKLYRKNFVN